MDLHLIKRQKRISSVLIVHTFGNLANINNEFINLCKKKSINIIEDAVECWEVITQKTKKLPCRNNRIVRLIIIQWK